MTNKIKITVPTKMFVSSNGTVRLKARLLDDEENQGPMNYWVGAATAKALGQLVHACGTITTVVDNPTIVPPTKEGYLPTLKGEVSFDEEDATLKKSFLPEPEIVFPSNKAEEVAQVQATLDDAAESAV